MTLWTPAKAKHRMVQISDGVVLLMSATIQPKRAMQQSKTHVRCTLAMRMVAMSSANTSMVRKALARPSSTGLASTMSKRVMMARWSTAGSGEGGRGSESRG